MNLQFHEDQQVKKAYREAKRYEKLELQFEEVRRGEVLKAVEDAGWVGLKVDPPKGTYGRLKAFKGKHGPCRDGEQVARYDGEFLGVWDDDFHLILKGEALPVCIKTGGVYGQEAYRPHLEVDPPEATEDVGDFDCDDLQKNLDRLSELLPEGLSEIKDPVSVYYGGPFSKAITKDGHLLQRGRCSLLPKEVVPELKGEDVIPYEDPTAEAMGLKNEDAPRPTPSVDVEPDWSALKKASAGLKEKLLTAMGKDKDVLILTGSDPQEEAGCCPSEDVGSANALVRAGLLDLDEKNEDGEGCSIGFYGIPRQRKGFPEPMFREKFQAGLQSTWKAPLRAILLLCVVIAMASGFYRMAQQRLQAPVALESLLVENQTHHLILFQEFPRCPPCLAMESLVKDFASANGIPFTTLELDDGQHLQTVETYGLFSATLFILKKEGEGTETALHLPAAELWNQPEAFRASLAKALGLE